MEKYIAAVSGGPDSMAMLDIHKKQILAVCHVNYNKRKTSKRDELIVKNFCKLNNINFFKKKVSRIFYFFNKNKNFQNLARQIRYNFFVKIGNKINCHNLLVAHTLDDFVETAFVQKNKKIKTLFLGIKQKSEFNNIKIFRPLIDKRKNELIKYCIDKKIVFGIDETNELEIYERNIVRKKISKWSDKQFNDFVKKIKIENKKTSLLEKSSREKFNNWEKSKYEIDLFSKINQEIKSEIIKQLFRNNKINYRSKDKFDQVIDFIENSSPGKVLRLGNNKFLKKSNKTIIISNKK